MTNPKCLGSSLPDTFSARSADSTGLKMRRITRAVSLDHLVGEREQIVGDFDAERSGCLEVDHELEFDRLQDRQVGGPCALENPRGVDAILAIGVDDIYAVAQQPARHGKFSKLIDGR